MITVMVLRVLVGVARIIKPKRMLNPYLHIRGSTMLGVFLSLCLFGENLVETARYRDLTASDETVYEAKKFVAPAQRKKIRLAMPFESEDLADLTGGDGFFWFRTLTDKVTGKQYEMILGDAGDNISGGIIEGNKLVASVEDGNIAGCKVLFDPKRNHFFQEASAKLERNRPVGGYFGRSLVELERIVQFKISLRSADDISRQLGCYDEADCAAVRAKYEIFDQFLDKRFYLNVEESGKGEIVLKEKPHFVVARVVDGHIVDQAAGFNLYNNLPWFHSN